MGQLFSSNVDIPVNDSLDKQSEEHKHIRETNRQKLIERNKKLELIQKTKRQKLIERNKKIQIKEIFTILKELGFDKVVAYKILTMMGLMCDSFGCFRELFKCSGCYEYKEYCPPHYGMYKYFNVSQGRSWCTECHFNALTSANLFN